MTKQGYLAEVERKKTLEKIGFHVTRNSGGIGATDLIAVKKVNLDEMGDFFVIRYEQVKKTRNKAFYFNERSKDELRRLKDIYKNFGIHCYFSIKFTNRGWKVINVSDFEPSPVHWEQCK